MANTRKLKKHVLEAVKSAKEILDKNPGDEFTVYKMAQMNGISRNVLQKRFKEMYGSGIRAYRLRVRMELSRKLLSEGRDAKEVSITVHYSAPSSFNNAFKKYWKVTPLEMYHLTKGIKPQPHTQE